MTKLQQRPVPPICVVLALTLAGAVRAATPAVPLDPIRAIVDAFETHDVVALGDGNHGNIQINDLRIALLHDAQFQQRVQDIVVEFGNARSQDVIERYVRGEAVPESRLRQVWEDTAQANPVWDVPVYAQFYRAVRDINATLAPQRRLRVLLGDVPFDWSRVKTFADLDRQPRRNDAFVADLLSKEVLARRHRALLVYGEVHLLRRPATDGAQTIVSALEQRGARIFSIYTNALVDIVPLQDDIAQWPAPALARISGTPLGAVPFTRYNPFSQQFTLAADGKRQQVPAPDPTLARPMEEQFDAVLYLGPPSTLRMSQPSAELCRDKAYVTKRFFRMELVGMGALIGPAKQYCGAVAPGSMDN